jgi:hypothetical protein
VKVASSVNVSIIPNCDLCAAQGSDRRAWADVKLPGHGWCYVCKQHFMHYRCRLGTGCGRRLILVTEPRQ